MRTAREPRCQGQTSRWPTVARTVVKLPTRLERAAPRGADRAVRRRQKRLRRSHEATLLAGRQVPQDARGQKPPGVDGSAALTPAARRTRAEALPRDGHAAAVRRVDMPTPGPQEHRPLGMPTIAERAQPGVVTHALEPAGDARFDPTRDGGRPGRRTGAAIGAIEVQIHQQPTGVLEADRAQCVDRLHHDAL